MLRARDEAIRELLDGGPWDDGALRRNLRDIRRINGLLGWRAAVVRGVARALRSMGLRAFSLLDVASGSADIPAAIAHWARREGISARIVASDLDPQIAAIAREQCAGLPGLSIERQNALALDCPSGSFDLALCTLALHHFAPDDAVLLLRELARVGRRVLVYDAQRAWLAYLGVTLLTRLLRMDPMTCHDAPATVRRAYSAGELRALASRAGLRNAHVRVALPYRLVLVAEGEGDGEREDREASAKDAKGEGDGGRGGRGGRGGFAEDAEKRVSREREDREEDAKHAEKRVEEDREGRDVSATDVRNHEDSSSPSASSASSAVPPSASASSAAALSSPSSPPTPRPPRSSAPSAFSVSSSSRPSRTSRSPSLLGARTMSEEIIYDAAVVGAGPAGAATATHLARAGLRVVLLEKARFPRDKPCAEYLSPAVEPLLDALGVRDELEAAHPARLRGFRIYAPGGHMFQGDFAATRDAAGKPFFETGLAIPRLTLDAALVRAAVRAGAELREGWRLADLTREGDGTWRLDPSGNADPVRARLLIGADGVHSTVARRLGLHTPGRLRKIALVAHVSGIADLSDYGEIHIAGRRYVGLAPLDPTSSLRLPSPQSGRPPDAPTDSGPPSPRSGRGAWHAPSGLGGEDSRRCNVALVVDERRDGPRLAGRPEAFLLDALESFPMLRGRLERAVVVRHTLAASRLSARARRLAGDGFLLVGDAGGYFDPFTGEGIYHALRSAELAAAVARGALSDERASTGHGERASTGRPYGVDTLGRYERLCRREFRGKHTIEAIIQAGVTCPPLMDHLAAVFARKPDMPHTVIAVTGDFLPPRAILRPGFLLRLII